MTKMTTKRFKKKVNTYKLIFRKNTQISNTIDKNAKKTLQKNLITRHITIIFRPKQNGIKLTFLKKIAKIRLRKYYKDLHQKKQKKLKNKRQNILKHKN